VKASAVRYLVDAGPLIGWFSRRDQWHEWSTQALQAVDDVLWTSEAVFAEACYQLGGNTPEVAALVGLADGGHLRLLPALGVATGRLRTLMAKYPRMDVSDASLVLLSEMHPDARIVTLDVRDFGVYRRFRNEPLPLICPR
jgi:predicted nucleic acid-binding protein